MRLGGGLQDFPCFKRMGNKIQMNLLTEGGRIQGDSKLIALALTCLEHDLAPGCLKEEENSCWVGRFYPIAFGEFFNCKREWSFPTLTILQCYAGIGNDLQCLGCLTSHSPICTENRRVQQQIPNFKFIEVHVSLKASLAQLVHMCFNTISKWE